MLTKIKDALIKLYKGEDGEHQWIPIIIVTILLLMLGSTLRGCKEDFMNTGRHNAEKKELLRVAEEQKKIDDFEKKAIEQSVQKFADDNLKLRKEIDYLKKKQTEARKNDKALDECLDMLGPNLLQ